MNALSKCIEELKRRQWENIRGNWLHHIPPFTSPGQTPVETVADVVGLDVIAAELATKLRQEIDKSKKNRSVANNEPRPILVSSISELAGLREAVFCESLFLLHKARHVVGAAEFHARDGMKTWALASAYQGSFFAARAILGFLGISFPEHNSKTIAIDLFPGPVTSSDDYKDVGFYYVATRMDHRNVWDVFQRILGVTTIDIWPKDLVNKLKSVESKYFAKQRNEIHYKSNGWILDDLHSFNREGAFAVVKPWEQCHKDIDFDRHDISMVVGFVLLKLAILLLTDLGKKSAKLAPELGLLADCREEGRHPLYGTVLFG